MLSLLPAPLLWLIAPPPLLDFLEVLFVLDFLLLKMRKPAEPAETIRTELTTWGACRTGEWVERERRSWREAGVADDSIWGSTQKRPEEAEGRVEEALTEAAETKEDWQGGRESWGGERAAAARGEEKGG